MKKALLLGILSSMFFAFTFILNRSMNLAGSFWMWGACLRYLITFPVLGLILSLNKEHGAGQVISAVKEKPLPWLLWGTVGFGLFYFPLCLGSVYGESWMTAASWQVTIVCGVLLTPLFGKKIPLKNILVGCLILFGIFLLQVPYLAGQDVNGNLKAIPPILLAAFAYPLGNRKMMEHSPSSLNTMQRIWGMVIGSFPFWLIVSVVALLRSGLPSGGQLLKSFIVAIFSGIIATSLFFHATDLVRKNPKQLALIEATQCGEVIFTLLGGIFFLHDAMPLPLSMAGLCLIVVGMIINSLISA